ncbi:MAG: tetratricopeptide repeat protein [Robiginitomaculum sp.]|nr:tetratricopeptide repeat protein [Robiginitomaculum sp.]
MTVNFEDFLNATPENPKREAKDSVGGMQIAAITGQGSSGKQRKVLSILKRAMAALTQDQPLQAVKLALRALDVDENSAVANHVLAVAVEKLGHLSKSLDFYRRAWELNPNDADIYQNLSLVAWKLDMLSAAEKFLRLFLEMKPGNIDGTINLSGVLRDNAKFDDAVELLRTALFVNEQVPALWNALGTVMLEQNKAEQAITFYEEALRLDPDFSRGWHNMAYAAGLIGDRKRAISAGRKALISPASAEDRETMRYGLGVGLLSVGEIEEGWQKYAARLHPDYENAMLFVMDAAQIPVGGDVRGKTILMIGEQGLGDEVMFLNACTDLQKAIGPEGKLKIAVEKRLVPIMSRSFPMAEVGGHKTAETEGRTFRVVDWKNETGPNDGWIPMAQIAAMYRNSLVEFPKQKSFLQVDVDRVDEISAKLEQLPAGPKIGVSWKSLKMNVSRSKYYSPFDDWKQVLKTPGAVFVNMQYGECEEEIEQIKQELGVTIHQIDGLDLKDDLDGVAAACCALDVMIGPMNATTNLGAACGANIWFLTTAEAWPLLGAKDNPWYPSAKVFATPTLSSWNETMKEVAAEVAKKVVAKAKLQAA